MVEIRGFREKDEEAIRSLFSLCFGKELSHEEWAWKYGGSPWGGTASVAVDGGEIIAHYGGLKMRFLFRGKTFEAFQPCDVMTHPKYRARIFSKRGAMVRAGEHFYSTNPMDFAFGFPSERHAVLGTRQLGYTEHGYVTVMTRKISSSLRVFYPFIKVETGWDSVDGKEIDTLWEEARDESGLSIEKKSRYIFWRYRDHPSRKYVPLLVRNRFGRSLNAFAVFSLREGELCVQDVFFDKHQNRRTLFGIIEKFGAEHGLEKMTAWFHPDEAFFGNFMRDGFEQEKGVPYIFRIINKSLEPSFLFQNYLYRMGDYDAS